MKISKEVRDLVISWLTISVAFAAVLSPNILNIMGFIEALPVTILAVGTAFIFHELAHRQVARHFGCHAEYRAWNFGLMLALALGVMAFVSGTGFIFAAPGAVYIFGTNISRKENGLISVAGPATNIIIGGLFLMLAFLITQLAAVFFMVGYINLFLAMFNLIPFGPLDGGKVFAWNPVIWGLLFFPLFFFIFIL